MKVIINHLVGISGKGDQDIKNITKTCQYITDELPNLKFNITNQIPRSKIQNNSIFNYVGACENQNLLLNFQNQKLDLNSIKNPLFYILDISSNNLQILDTIKKKKGFVLCSIQLKKTDFLMSKFLSSPVESFYEYGLKRKCNLEGHYHLKGSKKEEYRKLLMRRCRDFIKLDSILENESLIDFYCSFFLFSILINEEYIKYSNPKVPSMINLDEFLTLELKNQLD